MHTWQIYEIYSVVGCYIRKQSRYLIAKALAKVMEREWMKEVHPNRFKPTVPPIVNRAPETLTPVARRVQFAFEGSKQRAPAARPGLCSIRALPRTRSPSLAPVNPASFTEPVSIRTSSPVPGFPARMASPHPQGNSLYHD